MCCIAFSALWYEAIICHGTWADQPMNLFQFLCCVRWDLIWCDGARCGAMRCGMIWIDVMWMPEETKVSGNCRWGKIHYSYSVLHDRDEWPQNSNQIKSNHINFIYLFYLPVEWGSVTSFFQTLEGKKGNGERWKGVGNGMDRWIGGLDNVLRTNRGTRGDRQWVTEYQHIIGANTTTRVRKQ